MHQTKAWWPWVTTLLILFIGCSGDPAPDGSARGGSVANTNTTATARYTPAIEQQRILGFEGPPSTDWDSDIGTLSRSATFAEGTSALALQLPRGRAEVCSGKLSLPWKESDSIAFQLRLEESTPSLGEVQVVLRPAAPGAKPLELAPASIRDKQVGVFHQVVSSLAGKHHALDDDAQVQVCLVINAEAGRYVFDDLRFLGAKRGEEEGAVSDATHRTDGVSVNRAGAGYTEWPALTSSTDGSGSGHGFPRDPTSEETPLWSDSDTAGDEVPERAAATPADTKGGTPPRVALFELDDPDFCTTETLLNTAPFVSGISPLPNGTTIPYPLCTAQQYAHLIATSSLWSSNFVLMGDIDLGTLSPPPSTAGVQLSGVINGNGYALSNYTIESTGAVGVFGKLMSNGVIRNLTLRDFNVTGVNRVAALVHENKGLIEHITGINLTAAGSTAAGVNLGIAGIAAVNNGTLSDVTASVNVTGVSTAYSIGGLVGRQGRNDLGFEGSMVDCSVSGSVTRSAGAPVTDVVYTGGAIGLMENGSVTNTHSDVTVVSSEGRAGGLVGQAKDPIVGSSAVGPVTSQGGSVGGLVGLSGSIIESSFSTGSVSGTTRVGGLAGFAEVNANIVDSYATGNVHGTGAYIGGLCGANKGAVSTSYATGVVEGAETVGGLVGLLELAASSVTQSWATGATSAAGSNVGGLVGLVEGQVDASYARGAVNGFSHVGGLAGVVEDDGRLRDCASTAGTVNGVLNVGGLVGNLNGGVERCFATATVTGDTKVGGLVGVQDGDVIDSYATASVTANVTKAGGLVGLLRLNATVLRAYSAGSVTGVAPLGGFAGGMVDDSSVEDCHFNTTENPGMPAVGTNPSATGVVGNSDGALREAATFTPAWDFEDVWGILEGSSYPFLQPVPDCSGGGCSLGCPCPPETCTTDRDCEPGQVCGDGNGGYFDDPATNVCWDPLCETEQREQLCGETEDAPCGSCVPISDACDDPADADDGNPCTADSCDPVDGITHTPLPLGTSCDDGDLCNGADACDALGVCQLGTPLTCDDGNPCNGSETCVAETGCGAGTPTVIDDGDPCTADSCDPVAGVEHTPVPEGTSCSEADACNGPGTCDASGSCQTEPGPSIDDGNPCTDDSCDPVDGVLHVLAPVGTPCYLDACTVGASCDAGGFCLGGSSIVPDDGDPCTVDTCDPVTGVHSSVCTEDATVATTVAGSMDFLYTGENPAQQGVDPATIVVERAASIAGRVLDRDGIPVSGARVTVVGHPELGFTNTQDDGSYQLVVNGGGPLHLSFERQPYLALERQVLAAWGERTTVPDVVLIAPDPAVTTIDLEDISEPFQVHEASVVSDSEGTRQAVLLVPAGTQATMEFPDGTQTSIDTLNVRVTEFTVGDTGTLAMPGDLPAVSAYTHAFEVNADEAVQAGARSIVFDEPLIYYIDNFLDFPAGTTVPVGSFNRERGQWLAEENGLVIAITAIVGGIAHIDADGDGDPESDVELNALGMDLDERAKIAELHTPGASLWRVRIPHFTQPYDCNWGTLFPDDAEPPPDPPQPAPDPPNTCEGRGSIIECETQVLREALPLAGTEFSLNYASNRVLGRKDYRTMRVPLSGPAIPPSLKRIDLEVKLGGRTWNESFAPLPSQTYDFVWDGHDDFGRVLQGSQQAVSTVTFTYDGVYARTTQFGAVAGVALTGSKSRNELYMTRRREQAVGIWDARVMGFGGWTLNVHHAYEPSSGTLQLGDGRRVQALPNLGVVEAWPKRGGASNRPHPGGDGGPADLADYQHPGVVAAAADGSIYVADGHDPWQSTEPYNLRRIGPDGIINRFAGLSYTAPRGFNGDGLPALQTQFSDMADIEVGPDGSVFVADRGNHRVRRIGPDGIVSTVAGNGTQGFSGDGGLATNARLNEPRGIGLGRGGEIYIADFGNERIRKVLPNGNIVTIGGNGASPGPTNPGDGTAMGVADPIAPYDVAEHPDGSVYALEANRGVVRRYDLRGRVATVAGSWCNGCPAGEPGYGIPALGAKIGRPERIVIARDGTLYLVDNYRPRVIRVTPAGMLELVAKGADVTVLTGGVVQGEQFGDGAPVADIDMRLGVRGLALGPNGVYFTARDPYYIYRTRTTLPALGDGTMYVRAPDSQEVYVFDWQGRHVETRNRTGQPLFTFDYDTTGNLAAIADAFGNITTIQRAASGEVQSIVGPYGHVTELNLTGNGYLESAVDPANRRVSMTYDEGGLLKSFTDPRDNTSTMEYDDSGRLESDTDAAGGTQILSSTGDFGTRTITLESGEGTVKAFQVTLRPDGVYERVNTFPDGTQAIAEYHADGLVNTWLPDGTIQQVASKPDPRFGMQDPETTQTLILPSGLTRVVETNRSSSQTDSTDPFSITSEVTTTSTNGDDWVSTYTASTRRTETVSPEGRWSRTYVNAQGQLTRSELPNTLPVDLTYDTRGRLQTTTQGTRVRTNTYFNTTDGRNGYLQTATNPLTQLTTYERDAIGRVLDQTAPDNTVTSFDWDPNGNLIGLTPPGKPEHTQAFTAVNLQNQYDPPVLSNVPNPSTSFDFNLDRQPTTTWRPDGLTFERVYNDGKLDLIEVPGGTIDYSYFGTSDATPGSLSSILHPSGANLAYTYDGHLLKSTTWSGSANGGIQWTYNNDFRVATETVTTASATAPITFAYDDDGLQTCASPTTCPSGAGAFRVTYDPLLPRPTSSVSGAVTDTVTYNTYGELASYTASANGTLVYREILDATTAPRDALGRIVDRSETSGGVTTTYGYEYDLQGRLIEVYEDGDLAESYTYDDNGNRLTFETSEGVVNAGYDDQDRLLSYGNFAYTYTANGELLTKTDTSNGDVTEYEYDVLGNLVRVDLPNGDVIEYLVDGRNRRVGKRVNGTLVKQWLWASQLRIAAELDGAGNLVSRFVYGDKPTTPELVIRGSAMYRVISDHLGSVRALVNINDPSDVPVLLDYEAFGSVSGAGVGVIPQGFGGGLYDPETELVRFGARDYGPVVGRWVGKDPLRFETGDAPNLYLYVNGDPVNFIDPNGRQTQTMPMPIPWGPLAAGAAGAAVGGRVGGVTGALVGMCVGALLFLTGDEAEDEADCEGQYEIDMATCDGIFRRRGKAAGRRCTASAMERYGNCRAGRPIGPLDTWNN